MAALIRVDSEAGAKIGVIVKSKSKLSVGAKIATITSDRSPQWQESDESSLDESGVQLGHAGGWAAASSARQQAGRLDSTWSTACLQQQFASAAIGANIVIRVAKTAIQIEVRRGRMIDCIERQMGELVHAAALKSGVAGQIAPL